MSGENAEIALGKRLQQARQKAGLTQQDLCHKAGLSYSTLAKIERGAIKAPSIFTIQSIADCLGISIQELLGMQSPIATDSNKKVSKSGIRFIYFDVNGCLVRFFHRAFTRLAHESGAPAEVIETVFWHYNDAVCRGDMSMKEFNKLLGERLKLPDLDWMEYYIEAVDQIDAMQDVVRWATENYHVGLLTNIMPGFIDEMMKREVLPAVEYTAIIDSSKFAAIKPEQKIYEIATEKSGVKPEEILFIDDSRANLMAAEKMGWRVLWFDDYQPEESANRVKQALEF